VTAAATQSPIDVETIRGAAMGLELFAKNDEERFAIRQRLSGRRRCRRPLLPN